MEGKPPPPNPAMPYREDCWSEGATSSLIDAWGDRYVDLNRGNLRQKHWQEVADAVNARPGGERRPPRTDVQCKNRIDTLKKKYKIEKGRIVDSGGAADSQWPFYSRLDMLIGSTTTPAGVKKPPASPPLALPLPFHRKGSPLPAAAAAAAAAAARPLEKRRPPPPPVEDSFVRKKYSAAAAAAAAMSMKEEEGEDDDDEEADTESSRSSRSSRGRPAKKWKGNEEGEGDGIRHLARAIMRFGEIYEKVEAAKQRQMLELEKQRMEFSKELEFQRMQIFVDSQIQLAKIKRSRRTDADRFL